MAAGSAIAKKIAEYLAKGQVKKAARLEADVALRKKLWQEFEQDALSKIGGKPLPTMEFVGRTYPTYAAPEAAIAVLRRRGYSEEEAVKLTDRLYMRAYNDINIATRNSAAQPPPKIAPTIDPYAVRNTKPGDLGTFMRVTKAKAQMPTLHEIDFADELISKQLSSVYPDLKPQSIVELQGRLYKKVQIDSETYWLEMEPRSGYPPGLRTDDR